MGADANVRLRETRRVCGEEDIMIRTMFVVPAGRRAALNCVWVRTGNPARPLACRWVAAEGAAATATNDCEADRLCA